MNIENEDTWDCILKTVPRQTADQIGELVFSILWSYVREMSKQSVYDTNQFVV